MRATGWHNGGPSAEPAGYGLKFTAADRDRYFQPEWADVVLELEDGDTVAIGLSPSFWRSCSELRSAEVGRWLIDQGAAPWPKQSPPGIAVRHVEANRFSARILRQKPLGGR